MAVYSNLEIKVKGTLRTALSAEASTNPIDVDFFDEDDPNTAVELQSDTYMFEIDPLNKTGKGSEIILATSNTFDSPITDRTRLATVARGLSKEGHEQTGSASRAKSWDEGTEVAIATGSMAKMVNKLMNEVGTALQDDNEALQLTVYADATARDAAITAPTNGDMCFQTDEGTAMIYQGGAWANVDTGAAKVNASATVSGVVEIGTEAEVKAGTDSGATGAQLAVGPPELVDTIQDNIMFIADAQASDTYVLTLVPAIDALVTGQVFWWTAKTENTGACTLNVNGKGAKPIIKGDATALATGDILAGQSICTMYDGTSMVMMNPSNALVAGGNCTIHTHDVEAGGGTATIDGSANTDVAVTTSGTPTLIEVTVNGTVANDNAGYTGGNFIVYSTMVFEGSTLAYERRFLKDISFTVNTPDDLYAGTGDQHQVYTSASTFGAAPVTNGHQFDVSIQSLSATGFTLRFDDTETGTSAAQSLYYTYKVWT